MRIAFFGGSFDPPHRGHLAVATAAADRLSLDRVLVAPVGKQPLKESQSLSSYQDRLAMVKLAFEPDPRCEASTLDAPRQDGQHNYTYETLAALKLKLDQDPAQLFCLLGADSFQTLGHWHRAAELILLCDFIIAARPGYPLQEIAARLPQGVRIGRELRRRDPVGGTMEVPIESVDEKPDGVSHSARLYVLTDLEEDVSATALRQALASGDQAVSDSLLAPKVAQYIREHGLYRQASTGNG